MKDRLIRLVAKAIGDVDGVNAPTYEHLAKAEVAVIEHEFEGFRRENDRLRDLVSLQNTEIEKLRADKAAWQGVQQGTAGVVKQLEKENEKLRAALKRIDGLATTICMKNDAGYPIQLGNVMQIYQEARAAAAAMSDRPR